MIITCKVLTYDEKEESLTGNANKIWSDCAVDLNDVCAIRKSSDEGMEGLAVIHFKQGDYFILNLLYNDVLSKWMDPLR